MKDLDRTEYFKVSGIYALKSTIDSRIYIGSSNNLYKRINGHKRALLRGIHPNKYLQRFYDKYGENSLVVEIIEVSNLNLLVLEKKYIDLYDSGNNNKGFNIDLNPIERNQIPCSDETKKKMSVSHKTSTIYTIEDRIKNLKFAHAEQKRLKELGLWYNPGMTGKKTTEEAKQKQSKARIEGLLTGKIKRPNTSPISQYSLDGVFIKSFDACIDVEEELGISKTNVSACCRYKRKTAGGFKWKYKTNEEK